MENNNEFLSDIAIIGMDCRLPGANNINEYWKNLFNGVESIVNFTDEELRENGVDEELIKSPNYIKSRGIIQGAEYFDASFFGFTPREAELLDPQHRIFLECAWHALEDAGYDPEKSNARIGVFGGNGTPWHLGNVHNNSEVKKFASGTSIVTSNDKDYVTTRTSYKLNLTGPSVNVQCACSTSLVAVIMGVNSLLSYQSDMVLAGGATIELPEKTGYLYQEGGLESIDGKCRTFDKDASGTVFSRGCGVVLLKRLNEAIEDNDHIYAVIKGSAINNDGNKKAGFTAPSIDGQIEVAVDALEISGIDPSTITMVEAHGTATLIGDPIEVSSLTQTFQHYTSQKQYCAIGSVKTNIGHTDIAAGVAGLIKTALSLKNGFIPASLNFNNPNPKIDFENSPFYVNTELKKWEKNGTPRRALVNSFGVGGTNACAILEEAPEIKSTETFKKINFLPLSAKSKTALENTKINLLKWINDNPNTKPADIAYTYQVGRRYFNHRSFYKFNDLGDLISKLSNESLPNFTVLDKEDRKKVFLFPGQGNQYVNMGLDLYKNEPVFKENIDKCSDLLKAEFGFDLRDYIYPSDNQIEDAKIKINQTYITQPAIFTVSYAMAKLLNSLGIEPDALIGHSVGEYVAACLSGILTLQEALHLVAIRGNLIQSLPKGSMLAVLLDEEKVAEYLNENIEIGAMNNPTLTVLAGTDDAIDELENLLNSKKIFCKRLDTSHAFHSKMMEPILNEFGSSFNSVNLNKPNIPIISTLTGNILSEYEASDKNYWINHVRKPVKFLHATKTILEMDKFVFIEVGPGQSLESSVKRQLDKNSEHSVLSTMPSMNDNLNSFDFYYNSLGNLWAYGVYPNWDLFYENETRKRISLPTYPYERKPYSIDFSKSKINSDTKANPKNQNLNNWFYYPSWTKSLPVSMLNSTPTDIISTYLIIKGNSNLSESLCNNLKSKDLKYIIIEKSSEFTIKDNVIYSRMESTEDFIRVIDEIKNMGLTPNRIINLLNDNSNLDLINQNCDKILDNTFYSSLYLSQAFIQRNLTENLNILNIAYSSLSVMGEDITCPQNALLIGISRVIGKEFPSISSRFIDINENMDNSKVSQLAEMLIDEVNFKTNDTLVAYRNGIRWIEEFQNVPNISEPVSNRFKENGVYLITGGLGGLGLFLATSIAEKVKTKLVLNYVSDIPNRENWDKWLSSHSNSDSISEKILGIKKIEELGSEVLLAQANVSNYKEMSTVFDLININYGRLDGIIHSAGIAGGGIIPLKTQDLASIVIDPKFHGTLILHELSEKFKPDLFILFSSITSILGEAGRVDYCASNAFMDSFAKYRNQIYPSSTLSINWGQWGEIGMAVRWEESQAKIKAARFKKLSNPDFISFHSKKDNFNTIYNVNLVPENYWFINSHLVFGIQTVVGTAFIEIIRQLGEIISPDSKIAFENLYFVSPLMFENGTPKKVRIFLKDLGEKYKFSVKSQELEKDEQKDFWQEHFMGEFSLLKNLLDKIVNLNEFSGKFNHGTDNSPFLLNMQDNNGNPFLSLSERWNTLKEIKIGDDEWLTELNLNEEFVSDFSNLKIHPALLDAATFAAIRFKTQDLFLPFNYGNVKFYNPLEEVIFSHARLAKNFDKTDESITYDIDIYNKEGKLLIEIKSYSLKKVNQNNASRKVEKVALPKKADSRYSNPNDILADEGEKVFFKILSSNFIDQVIICTNDLKLKIIENIPNQNKIIDNTESTSSKNAYERPELTTPYEEPSNEIEKSISEIWQGILGLDKVGINDNFNELGGNSLLAIQTIANIAEAFNVDLLADHFYKNPTVKGLADVILGLMLSAADNDELASILDSLED